MNLIEQLRHLADMMGPTGLGHSYGLSAVQAAILKEAAAVLEARDVEIATLMEELAAAAIGDNHHQEERARLEAEIANLATDNAAVRRSWLDAAKLHAARRDEIVRLNAEIERLRGAAGER